MAGFSLIEALVAAALAALLVSALLGLMASSGRLTGAAEARHQAVMLADRLLAQPGQSAEGIEGDLRWTRQAMPITQPFDGYVLSEISVEVRVGERGRPVRATTRRITPQ